VAEQDLDEPVPDQSWQDAWDHSWGPQTRACQLLKSLDLGPLRKRSGLRMWKAS
jgi:hypothetical protein